MEFEERGGYRSFMREFVRLYHSLPAVWQVNNKLYLNRDKKNEAYAILLRKFKQRYPTATMADLKRKINSLRSNYRKELRKTRDNSEYKSRNWLFGLMNFLTDEEAPFPDQEETDAWDETANYVPEETSPVPNTDYADWSPEQIKIKPSLVPQKWPSEEYEQIARIWAMELARISPDQQVFVKKAISDILFEAQIGILDRYSVKIHTRPKSTAKADEEEI